MKKLALMVVASLACGVVLAQNELGDACAHEGAYSSHFSTSGTGTDTSLCTGGKWVEFKKDGKKRVLISYTITGDGISRSGSVTTIDGMPGSFGVTRDNEYDVSATKNREGKIVITKGVVSTGESIMFVPLLGESGSVTMVVQYSESILNSMGSVSAGDLNIQAPNVSKVGTSHTVTMDLDKEVSVPVQGVAVGTKTQYMLKIVATAS